MNVLNVDVSISRNSRDEYTITVVDDASRTRFLRLIFTAEQFAQGITGLSLQDVKAEVDSLDVIGKKKITEQRSIVCPLSSYSREALVEWLIENGKEDGWIVNPYLGSQRSILGGTYGGCTLNYTVYRFE